MGKPKPPKMLVVAGTVYGITDWELSAEQDELGLMACIHASDSNQLDEKENTPLTPNLFPQTPSVSKNHPYPKSRIGSPVIDLEEEEDDLSSATPVLQSRSSGLTPALNILNINTTTPAVSQTGLPAKHWQLLPSSPIVRHVNRNRPQQKQKLPCSSPPLPPLTSSPPPPLPASSRPRMAQDPWAPLANDPLADKAWHSHHPDGSPPRPRRGFASGAKPAPPAFQLSAHCVKRDSICEPLRQQLLKAKDKKIFLQGAEAPLIKVGDQEDVADEELYSEDEESDRLITPVKIPVKPPAEFPLPKNNLTITKSNPSTKKTPTAIPRSKPISIATTNSTGLKTPARTPAKAAAKAPAKAPAKTSAKTSTKTPTKTPIKTPSKTPSKTPAKTPAKTAPKTSSKPLSKTPVKTSISTLWSSQFTNNNKKRQQVNLWSDSEQDSDVHDLSDIEGGLGILRYVKSRAKVKPDPVKVEKGTKLDKKNTLAFYGTTGREDDDNEDNHAVFKQYLLCGKSNATKPTLVSTSEAMSSSSMANTTLRTKKVPIKQEDCDGGVVGAMKKTAPFTPKPSWIIHTKSTTRRVPTIAPTTVNLTYSQSQLLSTMGKSNKTDGLCGTKGFNCRKPFCWNCIEAEDDHI